MFTWIKISGAWQLEMSVNWCRFESHINADILRIRKLMAGSYSSGYRIFWHGIYFRDVMI